MNKKLIMKLGLVILVVGIMTVGYGGLCRKSDHDAVVTGSSGTPPPAETETVSTPNQPNGLTSGYTSTSYDYSTGDAFSSLEHSLEYRFDWGDGSYSDWSSSTTASEIWFSTGTYIVKAQARCATHTLIVSAWSSGISVNIPTVPPWQISTLDSIDDVGTHTSIALDSDNKVHISYYDWTNDSLKYATNASGSWVYTTLESIGNNPDSSQSRTSIALDSNNKVHISYDDPVNRNLKYATNVSGAWLYYTLDSVGWVGWWSSIAIDSNNKVHISYQDETNSKLKYATNALGSWVYTTIDSSSSNGWCTSIALDLNNKVHISYYEWQVPNCLLKYATNISGSWVYTTVDSIGTAIPIVSQPSIVLDSNNKAHISYWDNTNEDLKYATNTSGLWGYTTLDSTDDVGFYSSIIVDSNNKVHISYYDYGTNWNLKYANNVSGSWVLTAIDSPGFVGDYNSIALDSNNRVHISYRDGGDYDLKYATNK